MSQNDYDQLRKRRRSGLLHRDESGLRGLMRDYLALGDQLEVVHVPTRTTREVQATPEAKSETRLRTAARVDESDVETSDLFDDDDAYWFEFDELPAAPSPVNPKVRAA